MSNISAKKILQDLSENEAVDLLRSMQKIREFENAVQRSFQQGLVFGTTHLCQGQEAVATGVTSALNSDDYLTYTYRGHGVCIARGMSLVAAFAELFGRVRGVSKGLGGSMHLTDVDLGLIGSFGIVGAGLPCAVGAGLAAQLNGSSQVSISFFGDGATNIGAFHESMNLAAIWKLPVIFVCENNLYGEYMRINLTTPMEDLWRRAAAYEMPAEAIDGNNVLEVREKTLAATERARKGLGPSFLECKTYRQGGHSRTDPGKYRAPSEVQEWLSRDPIVLFRNTLIQAEIMTETEGNELMQEIAQEVRSAAEEAAAADWPDLETARMAGSLSNDNTRDS